MKLTNILNLLVLGSTLTITAVGCKTHPQGVTNIPGNKPRIVDENPNVPPGQPFNPGDQPGVTKNDGITGTTPPNMGAGHPNWEENSGILKSDAVYFEFDKSAIKSGEQHKLENVAAYLQANGSAAVRVEGNCDERGTEEYNKSLGERRALAAREYLIQKGIDAGRVDTLTRGEDNPAETGHSEASWSKNRRDEFIVLTQPKM